MDFYQEKMDKASLFSTCMMVNGNIYAFTRYDRLPVVVNVSLKKFVLLEDVKGYDPLFFADYMLNVGKDIFVLEANGNRLLKYNIGENECQYLNIGCHIERWDNYAAFTQYGQFLYIVPRYIDEVLKINIKSGKIQKDKNLYSRINNCAATSTGQKSDMYFCYGFQHENIMWLFQEKSNIVVSYDLEKEIEKKYELSVEINYCVHAIQYKDKMYILSLEGRIYCWNITDKWGELIADVNERFPEDNSFSRIIVTEKGIFLFPSLGKNIFLLHMSTRNIEKYSSYPTDFSYCGPESSSKYYGYCEDESYYYLAMRSMNYIFSLDKKSGEETWIKLRQPSYNDYMRVYIKYNHKMIREIECGLKELLNCLDNSDIEPQKEITMEAEKIWNQVKN